MFPTVLDVKTMYRGKVDDPDGEIFDDTVFFPGFNEAYDALFQAMTVYQVPRIEEMVSVVLPPLVTSISPADLGISNFAGIIFIRERPHGSTNRFSTVHPVDVLAQRPMADRLGQYNYRNGIFYFIGATNAIEIEVKYDTSGQAPTAEGVTILVDNSRSFLANFSVGKTAGRKGLKQTAQDCFVAAVGPKYVTDGAIGGELMRLIQPLVRNRQLVQVAPHPFRAGRGIHVRRALPYVQAQQGTTGGGSMNVPIQFSTIDGTIIGAVDGINTIFYLSVGLIETIILTLNGLGQTSGLDYSYINNQITFAPDAVPTVGSVITAWVTLQGFGGSALSGTGIGAGEGGWGIGGAGVG